MSFPITRELIADRIEGVVGEPYKRRLTEHTQFSAVMLCEMALRYHDAEIVRIKKQTEFAEGVTDVHKYVAEQLHYHQTAHKVIRNMIKQIRFMKIGADRLEAFALGMEEWFKQSASNEKGGG